MPRAEMTLVETSAGHGYLIRDDGLRCPVRYHVLRYQALLPGSGMPVPGLHRIEGAVELGDRAGAAGFVGLPLTLKLEDGRSLRVALADESGRIFTEGHGPGCCACC